MLRRTRCWNWWNLERTDVSYSDVMHSVLDCFSLDSLLNISYKVIMSSMGRSKLKWADTLSLERPLSCNGSSSHMLENQITWTHGELCTKLKSWHLKTHHNFSCSTNMKTAIWHLRNKEVRKRQEIYIYISHSVRRVCCIKFYFMFVKWVFHLELKRKKKSAPDHVMSGNNQFFADRLHFYRWIALSHHT